MNDHRPLMPLDQGLRPLVCGSTDVYLILGDPVEQVLAPAIFNPLFAARGIDAVLVPVQVAPAQVADFVKIAFMASNIKGMWVTMAHKSALVHVLDHCSALGRLAGAVNAIRRNADGSLEGGLFDGEGFVGALRYFNIRHTGQRVLVLGAGGAAAAIGASLAHGALAAAELAFYDPAPGQADAVVARLAPLAGSRVFAVPSSDPMGFDLVINASPLGLKPTDPLPCDVARLAPRAALVDIVMKNQPTPVVRAARARGLKAQPGFEMLIQQAHLYLDFFGFSEAARAVQADASALRMPIYPAELQNEIQHVLPAASPFVSAPQSPLPI